MKEWAEFAFFVERILVHLRHMKRAILSLSLFFAGTFLSLLGPAVFHAVTPVYAADSTTQTPGESACAFISDGTQQSQCKACFDGGGAWTAIGCFGKSKDDSGTSSVNDFLRSLIGVGTGIGGGIAMLLILFSGFQRITSAGNPEKLHEAKELMTAAISGLLLIIFSVFLLRLIGVDILQIPGFG